MFTPTMLDLLFALASLSLLSVPLALVALFLLSAPFGAAMGYFVTQGPNGMAGFFRADRGLDLGWPVGIQEQDAPAWRWQHADRPDDGSLAFVAPGGHELLDAREPADQAAPVPGFAAGPTPPSGRLTPYGFAPTRIGPVRVRVATRRTPD